MLSSEVQRQLYQPSHRILRRINSLDRVSSNFLVQLIKCLSGDGYDYPVTFVFEFGNVDDRDKIWLIWYLDKVRGCVSSYLLSTELLQVLGDLEYDEPGYRICQMQLQAICRLCGRLPPSCTLSVSSLVPAADPTPIGPYEIICEGTLNGLKVCAKKLKPSFSDWGFVMEVLCQDCNNRS